MCGINGIIHLDGRLVSEGDLRNMNYRMLHRGPDDEGYFFDGNAGLSMRRLSIIDLEGGHQPISNEDGRYHVVLNGEIYNYLELREELEGRGHAFRTNADTEVLVHLYEDEGENLLDRLNGMYAFAIWDCHEKELFMANDRMGIKTLYYRNGSSVFCFSSELKSILSLNIERSVDRLSLLSYLFLLYVPHPKSMVKDVFKLEPATCLRVNGNGKIKVRKYWRLGNIDSECTVDFESFKDKFMLLLSDAIRLQLRSDVPVGTFLSGGIDSSTVVAMLVRQVCDHWPVRTFSVGYEGHHVDERYYAAQVAKYYKTMHTELFIAISDVRSCLGKIAWYMDEPIGDSAALPTYLLSETARSAGVKVILNGTGGDEIFGGYSRYLSVAGGFEDRLRAMLGSLRGMARSFCFRPLAIRGTMKSMSPVINYLTRVNGSYIGLRGFLCEDKWFESIVDDINSSIGERFDSLVNIPDIDRMMRFDIETYLAGDLLFLLDKMTMAASIEGRVPLIDHRMVEFMSAIPASLKIENGELKGLVKRALRGILPDEVLDRQKMGFGGPVAFWLQNDALDGLGIFDDVSSVTRELFRVEEIRKVVREKRFNKLNAQFIYNLAVFELWYKDVFDAR